ncbi:MAG: hypothetical protein AAF443_04785 [Chlamydiota bacterium]
MRVDKTWRNFNMTTVAQKTMINCGFQLVDLNMPDNKSTKLRLYRLQDDATIEIEKVRQTIQTIVNAENKKPMFSIKELSIKYLKQNPYLIQADNILTLEKDPIFKPEVSISNKMIDQYRLKKINQAFTKKKAQISKENFPKFYDNSSAEIEDKKNQFAPPQPQPKDQNVQNIKEKPCNDQKWIQYELLTKQVQVFNPSDFSNKSADSVITKLFSYLNPLSFFSSHVSPYIPQLNQWELFRSKDVTTSGQNSFLSMDEENNEWDPTTKMGALAIFNLSLEELDQETLDHTKDRLLKKLQKGNDKLVSLDLIEVMNKIVADVQSAYTILSKELSKSQPN